MWLFNFKFSTIIFLNMVKNVLPVLSKTLSSQSLFLGLFRAPSWETPGAAYTWKRVMLDLLIVKFCQILSNFVKKCQKMYQPATNPNPKPKKQLETSWKKNKTKHVNKAQTGKKKNLTKNCSGTQSNNQTSKKQSGNCFS